MIQDLFDCIMDQSEASVASSSGTSEIIEPSKINEPSGESHPLLKINEPVMVSPNLSNEEATSQQETSPSPTSNQNIARGT
jgi:hypothetical protein